MSDNLVTLFVLTDHQFISWKGKCIYRSKLDGDIDFSYFVDGKKAMRKLDINKYRKVRVAKDARVIDVINEARKSIPRYQKDNWTAQDWLKEKYPTTLKFEIGVSYSLYCPAIGDDPLDDSSEISKFGITDLEVVVIKPYNDPRVISLEVFREVLPVKDFTDFQKLALSKGDPKEREVKWPSPELLSLNAVLLYTDEDVLLAKYVRENFDKLHKMSGDMKIFVLESPPRDSVYAAPHYWKSRLEHSKYFAWSLLGWVRCKPYDRSAAYEIARALGIFPDELPCLAVFDTTDQVNKIIFPIGNDFPSFFRKAISGIQRSLRKVASAASVETAVSNLWAADIPWEEREKRHYEALLNVRHELFEELQKSIKQLRHNEDTKRVVYNFFGQTVFINHPEGAVRLQEFQNTTPSEKENKYHE